MQPVPEPIIDAIEAIDLPCMPQVLLRFLRMTEDDGTGTADLARVVGQDPGLAAHVVIAARAAGLATAREPGVLQQCLSAIGTSLARTTAGCLAIQNVFARAAGEQTHDLSGFWRHSLQVAELARDIAIQLDRPDYEDAYLAGLLHDIGQLLLSGGLGGRYGALLAWSRDEDVLIGLERPELGTDHAAVGAWLIDQWRLPSFVADAVLFHHCQPGEISSADPLSRIVWAAHAAANRTSNEPDGRQFEASAIETMLGLRTGSLLELQRQSALRVAQLASTLDINVSPAATPLPRSAQAPFELARAPAQEMSADQIEFAVRDMAVMEPLQRHLLATGNEAEMLQAVRESMRILFGTGRLAFLMLREDQGVLSGVGSGGPTSLLERLEVPLRADHSQAAASAAGGEIRTSFGASSPSLADVQIARALGGAEVLYLPLRGRKQLLGVIACGVSRAQHERCRKQLAWMTHFARLAAVCIESRREALAKEKRVEAELIGRFEQHARQVAHEAGNPLSIITNYLKIVSDRLSDDSGVRRELGILKEEIDRVGRIVRRIGDLTSSPSVVGTTDVNAVIEGMAALYRESLFSSRGITLDLILDDQLQAIPGARDQVKQILLNLWKNAAESLSAGGRVIVSTTANVTHAGRQYAEIRIADSGPGLPIDVIQHMFQPLDPERRPGHAGMGLSIVAGLVKELGGQITFQTRAAQGTTFVVLLPMSEGNDQ